MLKDEDRIFKNLYNDLGKDLISSQKRGDWTNTKELVDKVFSIANKRDSVIRLLAFAKSAIRHNMSKDLPTFKMPFCMIWGENDKVTPPHVGKEFNSLLPNSELHWIDKCGHSPMWEHPVTTSNIVIEWAKRNIHT